MKRLLSVMVLCTCAACGSKTPDGPGPASVVQVAGVWRGTVRVTSATGGECLAPFYQGQVGSSTAANATFTQTGSNLTMIVTLASNGAVCNYTGTAGASDVQLTGTCSAAASPRNVPCSIGSGARDVTLTVSNVNGTVNGNTLTGTEVETSNVTATGSTTVLGTLTLSNSFVVTKQ
jgi:hypothetical protein